MKRFLTNLLRTLKKTRRSQPALGRKVCLEVESLEHRLVPSTYSVIQRPSFASDIAAGANGAVWATGTDTVPGGHSIYRWTGSSWQQVAGGAVDIAVDPSGNPWVVNSNGDVFHYTGSGWQTMGHNATDVAVGANGAVWIIEDPGFGADGVLERWTGSGWQQPQGAGGLDKFFGRLAVDPSGNPWVTGSSGAIERWVGNGWQQEPAAPSISPDIDIGRDGSVWAGGPDGIYHLNGSSWERVFSGSLTNIAVDASGNLWFAHADTHNVEEAVVTTVTAPAAPNLTATAASSTQIKLSWSAVAGATGYTIQEWNGSAWQTIGSAAAGTTTVTVGSLAPGSTYYFQVGAYNTAGTTWSAYKSATTLASIPPPPANFAAKAISSTQVYLSWSQSAGATGYVIQWWNGSSWQNLTTVGANAIGSTVNVSAGYGYYFRVGAFNSAGTAYSGYQYA